MKIYLIRHGESLANLGLVSADFSMDNQNSLSQKGENQIQAIILAFQNCNIVRIFFLTNETSYQECKNITIWPGQ